MSKKLGFIERRRYEKAIFAALETGLAAMERGDTEEPDPAELRNPYPATVGTIIDVVIDPALQARADRLAIQLGLDLTSLVNRAKRIGLKKG